MPPGRRRWGVVLLAACVCSGRVVRLHDATIVTAADAGDSDEHLADALAASMPRRCATAEAGSPLMHASSLDDPDKDEYQIMDCDAPVQAIFFVCVMEKLPAETSCGRDVLEHLQNDLVDEDSAAATWTLAMMDATDEFNSRAASDPTFRFSVDFVTVNWHIAWYLHELTQFDRPLRALEIGAFEGRSAWLWRRLLPAGSKLTTVDLAVQLSFWNNTQPLVDEGFLTVLNGRASSEALFELDPADPFDVVYVDGSHQGPQVLGDAVMADALLRPGGMLIFDDFEWEGVARACRAFWDLHRARYDVLHVLRQLVLRKRPDA